MRNTSLTIVINGIWSHITHRDRLRGQPMNDVISIDFRTRWSVPVGIVTPDGFIRIIASPEDALSELSSWPLPHGGEHFKQARRVCIGAICGRRTPDEARDAFIYACQAAKVLLSSH